VGTQFGSEGDGKTEGGPEREGGVYGLLLVERSIEDGGKKKKRRAQRAGNGLSRTGASSPAQECEWWMMIRRIGAWALELFYYLYLLDELK
jgi:hypothetical protein